MGFNEEEEPHPRPLSSMSRGERRSDVCNLAKKKSY